MTCKNITSAILAGGKSKRFGEDKGLYKINGTRLIEYVLKTLKALSDSIVIVTNKPEEYKQFDALIITDRPEFARRGPLSGLYAALQTINTERLFLTACDMPFICPNLIKFMWSLPDDYDVIVPYFKENLQPLHAIYHKNTICKIEKLLSQNKNSLKDLINNSKSYIIPENIVKIHASYPDPFININTKEDLIYLKNFQAR